MVETANDKSLTLGQRSTVQDPFRGNTSRKQVECYMGDGHGRIGDEPSLAPEPMSGNRR